MKVRLLTALGMVVFGLPLLIFSDYIVYPVALAAVSALAAWELLRVLGLHRRYAVSLPSYALAALLPFFSYKLFVPAEEQRDYILIIALSVFAYLLYLAAVSVLSGGELKFSEISRAFMAVSYSTVSFTALSLLRYMENGEYLFELVFIGAWVSDSFAYFTGRLLGRHKLAPRLSPKKTVEGSVGGIVFATLAFVLYGFIIEYFFGLQANYLALALSGVFASVISQLGDLFASLIKREYDVKDYSGLLPGHGGIMDRFDSILAAATTLMVICTLFPPFSVG
nr:phosphatidate cytidylyltransferase [Clostridia bacterium]